MTTNIAKAFFHQGVCKIEIKINEKVIHRDAAPLNNEKELKRILDYLDIKGYYDIEKLIQLEKESSIKKWV